MPNRDVFTAAAADTHVYLVRHAHAVWTPDEGRPLSSAGASDAQRVAELLHAAPIAAMYASPSRRAIDTVAPLAERLGIGIALVGDLRERDLPPVPADTFEQAVLDTWLAPDRAPHGGESNAVASARGLAVLQRTVARHAGTGSVLATHGTLMVLVLHALDSRFDYAFWQRLTFPDIYRVSFARGQFVAAERVWCQDGHRGAGPRFRLPTGV
jgi:2,3-bisphosphoglycerate-dependent phosphoglycerate mutase